MITNYTIRPFDDLVAIASLCELSLMRRPAPVPEVESAEALIFTSTRESPRHLLYDWRGAAMRLSCQPGVCRAMSSQIALECC